MALIIVVSTGCASIINEKTQKINVGTSTGESVNVAIDGIPFQAPGIATVTRSKADKIITTSNPKCSSTTILPSKVDNVFWINILSGGAFGSTTDYGTEKMWQYEVSTVITCKS